MSACEDDSSVAGDAGAPDGMDMVDGGQEPDDDSGTVGQDDEPTLASIETGEVRGDEVDGAVRFLKIPYAKPPVGELRWKAPEKPEAWEGVRHEKEFSEPCPQAMSRQSPESVNEDCLYLNVWRPAEPTEDAPVMVWIHGGGNTTGSAADTLPVPGLDPDERPLWYDGRVFAERHGIVLVSINYRLGVFGFFAHPALAEEGSPRGNQGLFDQVLALEWVRDNIEAFGGDPGNITIFGESAGSADVCLHMVSPLSRGLFHRAISESGGCTMSASQDQAEVDAALEEYAMEVGCEGEAVLECLRDKEVTDLISLEATDRTTGAGGGRRFGIAGDGEFLPKAPAKAFDEGDVAQVPYILGSNSEEGKLYFVSADVPTDEEEYLAELEDRFGEEFGPRVAEQYPVSDFDGDYRAAMARLVGDSGLVCGTHDTARRAADAGLEVYMYNFNIDWSIAPEVLGPTHASEISHVFGVPYNESDENQAVAEAMNTYWASFAATGEPNWEDAPATWPRFSTEDDKRLQFDPDYEVLTSFRADECALWREYAASQQ